jgi:hypothetical protein
MDVVEVQVTTNQLVRWPGSMGKPHQTIDQIVRHCGRRRSYADRSLYTGTYVGF